MEIQIRRNQDIVRRFKFATDELEFIRKVLDDTQLSEEQREALKMRKEAREKFEDKIWNYFKSHTTMDLSGDVIAKETHEIGYDVEYKEIDGKVYGIAKNAYVRPKISELSIK